MIDTGLYISYILIFASLLVAVLMPLFKAFGDPKSLKSMLIGVGGILLVFLLGYMMADGTIQYEDATQGASKMVGAGLITMYLMMCLTILGIVFSEIQSLVK